MTVAGERRLECVNLRKVFRGRNGELPVLDNVSFDVGDQEFVCFVGPSGCGKTTLLRIIAGLEPPSSGVVQFNPGFDGDRAASAMVFQEHGLFPWMSVTENVAFSLETRGVPYKERRLEALGHVEKVGLGGFADCLPHELSVGMRQRVAIARAFLADPHLFLMDEPFGSLDAQTRLVLQEELLRLWGERRGSVVFVTHDIEEAILLGDRVLVLSGRPSSVLSEFPIPLGRPRGISIWNRKDLMELKWQIWEMLGSEVRKGLSLAP
jgi:NitT/TauT family transport system ATP-binding protein